MDARGGHGVTADAAASGSAAIVLRIRAGDAAAWSDLEARHGARLRLFVRARMGRALARVAEPDDVLQETWLRAAGSISRFEGDGPGALQRWLSTLALHVLADLARAARAKKRGTGRTVRLERSDWSGSGGGPPAGTMGPATRAAAGERAELLERAYLSLSAPHRRVLRLRQFEQLPAREAAAVLGTTEGAVHALYRRALDAWGAAFEGLGGSAP